MRLPSLIATSLLRRLDESAIRAEIQAQLDAFERTMERRPAFVDGHQHVHQLPVVRTQLLEELTYRYADAKPWLRCARVAHRASAKSRVIEMLGSHGLSVLARRLGFQQNRHLLGVYDFLGDSNRYSILLAKWIDQASSADLLMCHAGNGNHAGDPLCQARASEYRVLASPEFGDMLSGASVELSSMSHILSCLKDRSHG